MVLPATVACSRVLLRIEFPEVAMSQGKLLSFDIALSGLNSAATELDVISHNISNAATTGFKSSRAEFADVYAASTDHRSGEGVTVSNVRQSHASGKWAA